MSFPLKWKCTSFYEEVNLFCKQLMYKDDNKCDGNNDNCNDDGREGEFISSALT